MNLKSQSFSMDVILGVIVILTAFFIFYAVLNPSPDAKLRNLKEEVASEDSMLRVVDNNMINESRVGMLKNISYDDLKRRLRVEGDFCIYVEDEKGSVVLINNTYIGVGSPNISLSGVSCS